MRVTRKDIAAAAGVAPSTVGMILSGSRGRYHPETRRKVLEVAERLGYQRNVAAKAMRLRRSLLVGVLFNEMNAIHATAFLRGLQEALAGSDYTPLIFFNRGEAGQQAGLEQCLSRRVDALFINSAVDCGSSRISDFAKQVAESGLPVLEFFGGFLPGVAQVDVDNQYAGRVAVGHLAELGHRRIALMTHSRYQDRVMHRDACDMAEGYVAAMTDAGLEPQVVALDFDYATVAPVDFVDSGKRCLEAMMAGSLLPTAVVCYADFMAYGLNRACRARGIRVPEEMSILGNGNLMFSEVVNPPLSSVGFDAFQVGLLGARQLLETLDGKPLESVSVRPSIIVRQSTGPVPLG